MRFSLAINWWSLVIRGLLGITVGIVTFIWPGITLAALVFLFAGYALIDGIMSLTGAIRAVQAHERWGILLIEGIAGIGAAVVTVLWPAITAISLVFVIAAWAIVTGIVEIAAAIRLRSVISGEWLLALSGVASVVFGVLLAVLPVVGAIVLAMWFGVYALIFGVLMVALGFRLRNWDRALAGGGIPAPAH
jgi:uncharacterized membrane protein HdeD (DUF308 family)